VVGYSDFVEYLMEKLRRHGREARLVFLPFKGKNRVVYSPALV
jgi:hypothetical protein